MGFCATVYVCDCSVPMLNCVSDWVCERGESSVGVFHCACSCVCVVRVYSCMYFFKNVGLCVYVGVGHVICLWSGGLDEFVLV